MRLITNMQVARCSINHSCPWGTFPGLSDPSEVFENLRQSFKPNPREDCLIRTTDRELVTLSCIFALVGFCLTLGKLHTLWGFSYFSNADNTCLILGPFKVLDESCFISLLHYQEMPDLEVIMNYGRCVNTHAPLF